MAEASGGLIRGAEVRITKRIPVAAGLGGGSADAAATLLALNELWGGGLDRDALLSIGEQIGSDVPAMLAGGPVMMRGRGERIVPVHALTHVVGRQAVRLPDRARPTRTGGGTRTPARPGPTPAS